MGRRAAFSAAFHEAPIAMLLIDPIGVVLDANPALGASSLPTTRGGAGRHARACGWCIATIVTPSARCCARSWRRTKPSSRRNGGWSAPAGEQVWVQGWSLRCRANRR